MRGKTLAVAVLLTLIMTGYRSPGLESSSQEPTFVLCRPENISGGIDGQQSPGVSTHPRIAVDSSSGDIYIAWEEDKAGNSEISLSRFTFNASCFPQQPGESPADSGVDKGGLELINVSNNAGPSKAPDLVLGGQGTGFVVWEDKTLNNNSTSQEAILLRRFTSTSANGFELQDTLSISEKPEVASLAPSIAVDRFGHLFIAWEQDDAFNGSRIIFQSDRPYAPKISVSEDRISPARAPRLAVNPDNSKAFLVWQGSDNQAFQGDPTEIFFSSSSNTTESFMKPVFTVPAVISHTPGDSEEPAIVFNKRKGTQLVVWSDATRDPDYNPEGDWDVLFRRSPGPFSLPFNISGNCPQGSEGDSRQPAITVDSSGNILVAWQEQVDQGSGSNEEIFLASSDFQSTDPFGCLNVSEKRVELVNGQEVKGSPLSSSQPALAVDSSGNVFIVWEEEEATSDNTEIYFMALKRK